MKKRGKGKPTQISKSELAKKTEARTGPIDGAARETVAQFAQRPKSERTSRGIQASFHAAERKAERGGFEPEFPVVAVGSSTGGVDALVELFSHVPSDTGAAFVLIQHLSPHRQSLLPEILSRVTSMSIEIATTDRRIQPNHVYLIPPNANMGLINGLLKILPRIESPGQHMPIDFFFRCLSDDQSALGIGVVLSGTDSDGAQGLLSIRARGGLTMAQLPETAKADGMPRNAIAAGGVDLILSLPEIAAEIARIAKHPLAAQSLARSEVSEAQIGEVFRILKAATDVDFSKYKPGTVFRRVRRRLLLHKAATAAAYLELLKQEPGEVVELYNDLLINVTSFFRDPSVFERLKAEAIPRILKRAQDDAPIRIWVPGCSTGEEAYSLAIAFVETMEDEGRQAPIQIFASDISERSLEKARLAEYPASIAADVSGARLRRFFTKTPGGYAVIPAVRELCVFALHDVARDPPFSRLDLISCRNLMIYFGSEQQKAVMSLFSYALNADSFLMLGASETSAAGFGFEEFDKQARLYLRRAISLQLRGRAGSAPSTLRFPTPRPLAASSAAALELERSITRVLIERFAPVGVVVDADMQIVQFRGQTGAYLEPASGSASLNLFKMARSGLDSELRLLMRKSVKSARPQVREGVSFIGSEGAQKVSIEAVPLRGPPGSTHYLILFDEHVRGGAALARGRRGGVRPTEAGKSRESERVNEELAATREHVQSIIREHEMTNSDLQAAHEEVVSSNEELQSTNEELETAKEELQSTNEELSTVNDELNDRNARLVEANNDLSNLLGSVDLAIMIVGADLRLRRMTSEAGRIFNVIPSDVGRPITDIKANIEVPDLDELIGTTIETSRIMVREARDRAGNWYSLRIRPYRAENDRIDGAILILVDIGASRGAEPRGSEIDGALLNALDQPVVLVDSLWRVRKANGSFYRAFEFKPGTIGDRAFFELNDGAWANPMLKALLSDVFSKSLQIVDFRFEGDFRRLGVKKFSVNARKVQSQGESNVMIMLDEIAP